VLFRSDYAIFKLPLFWLKNGVNNNTFMNHLRKFKVLRNGAEQISFTLTSINLQGTGLSSYTVRVPNLKNTITLDITAEFTPLDDGSQWTAVEYCDLYPFDNVYRRTFHYKDITFLTKNGVFDRVGTGAWSGRFETIEEPERLSYYARYALREGPGSRCPDSADGTVWILGSNPERGNILYRRGTWAPSSNAQSMFSLCNAWVDIHNTVINRTDPSSREHINFTLDVFSGAVPPLDVLNDIYMKAAGGAKVMQISRVLYGESGDIKGFEVNKK
jgi:hypothetical protein